jgi:hypothetical protein
LLALERGVYLGWPAPYPALAVYGEQRLGRHRGTLDAVKETPVTFYSAMIETRADDNLAVNEDAIGLFLNAVQPFHGAVTAGGDPQGWSARISIEARDAADAVAVAAALVTRLAADIGLPGWPVVRAEAAREDVFDEDLARPPSSSR